MKRALIPAVAATVVFVGSAQAQSPSIPLTLERVFASPALSGPAARGVEVSPDGRFVTYLKPEAANQYKLDLWSASAQMKRAARRNAAGGCASISR